MQQPSDILKVAFLGDYLPKKCGIAMFTADLRCAVAAEFPAMRCLVMPVNDLAGGYDYPEEVRFEIAEQDLPSYLCAADFLNITDVNKVNGRYAMISRQDDENILIMFSDNIHFWAEPRLLRSPAQPWEFIKMGNCGSPIETEACWLVLSHGVGAMRKYCLGAFLLDRKDPTKLVGRLREPLLCPNEAEREGYVPSVVYTCGVLLHGCELVIPYAMSDYASSFATVSLDGLLGAMM